MKTKRFISLLLSLILILTALPLVGVASFAETSGDFEYEIIGDGTAEITYYSGDAQTLYIPSTIDGYPVTGIGKLAFYTNDSLSSVIIPNGVTYIGEEAFSDCNGLTDIVIPESVKIIDDYAFWYCSNLTGLTIPNGVETIGEEAFCMCRGSTSLNIPESVVFIGNGAFSAWEDLTEITVDESNANFSSRDGVLFNKDKTEIILYPIGKTETSYIIPDGVTSIGESAFAGSCLSSIIIPDSVTNMGDYAFSDCAGLASITIPEKVTSIGKSVFYDCSSLTSVTIPDSVTSIGDYAFNKCGSLTYAAIPDGLTSIGEESFAYCCSLYGISIPESVTSIGAWAFYDTGYYQNYSNWENGVLYIDNCLIAANSDEISENYEIKEGTRLIADTAVADCYGLTSAAIPDSVVNIGRGPFIGCTALTEITVDGNNENYCSYDGILFNTDKTALIQYPVGKETTSYAIPDSVESVGYGAFAYCAGLTDITIPNSVTSIGEKAVMCCDGLTSITLPESVAFIGNFAFADCRGLTDIYILNRECEIINNYQGTDTATILPYTTIHAYAGSTAEEYANKYGNRFAVIEGEPTNPDTPKPTGEVSGDGKLSTVDAKWILQNIAKSREFSDEQFKAADLNGDGKLSVVDVKWVLQIIAGMRDAETLELITK